MSYLMIPIHLLEASGVPLVYIAARRLNYCAQEAMAESVLYKKLWYNTKVLVEADDRSQ